ncbi:ethanolamine kinase 1-like isoform X2 [Oscarella lobularis]|uniref:ethanolamine kinase 1-like isoform X2 n=1 Tax=Oscarella lobularis TaxID=121494 RepID=UPI0033132B31
MARVLDLRVDKETLERDVPRLIEHIRPEWDPKTIRLRHFSDGLTNFLVGCYSQADSIDADPSACLVRLYGNNTDLIIDREREKRTFETLHAAGCGPPLLATFSNGCSYGYVPGKTLDVRSVRDDAVYPMVVAAMAKMHGIRDGSPAKPVLFETLDRWIGFCAEIMRDARITDRLENSVVPSEEGLSQELGLLKETLIPLGSPVLFCHNDLLIGNIILNESAGKVSFIDYEYAGYNYRGFDIANHFCEFAGINDVDYNLYPDKDLQMKWLKAYLKETNGSESSLDGLYVEVNKFALASHFFWGVWALIQTKYSEIDFDFLGYSIIRFTEYFRRKNEFLSL